MPFPTSLHRGSDGIANQLFADFQRAFGVFAIVKITPFYSFCQAFLKLLYLTIFSAHDIIYYPKEA